MTAMPSSSSSAKILSSRNGCRMKSRAQNGLASRSSRCCSAAVRGCPSSSTQYVDVTNKQLPPEKFYERLSHVTPRGERSEHPAAETLTKREPAQSAAQSRRAELVEAEVEGSAHEAPKFKFSIRQWWWIIAMIVGMIGIGIVLWLNGTFQPAAIPTPTETSSPAPHPSSTASLTPTPKPTLTPIPSSSSTAVGGQSVPMILVPAGNFIMGSDNGNADEKPVHTVFLDAFYIDKYKVTNALYKLCVDNYVCAAPRFFNSYLRPTYYGDVRYDQYPVIGVTWDMAKAYCEWRGARLLTEAEWEKAARGTDGRMYPWGNSIDQSRANYNNNGDPNYVGDTSKVDAYPSGVKSVWRVRHGWESLGMGGGYLRCELLRLVDFAGCESAWTDIGTLSRDTRRLMGFRCDEFAFRVPQLEWSIECKYLCWVSMREEFDSYRLHS